MKKIMLIILAAAALLLCGCGTEIESGSSDDEYIEVVLPPRQKLINVQKLPGESTRVLTRPFKAGEKAEEYFFIATSPLVYNYKIKEQE